MKHFGKLAVLGAILAASAPLAFASSIPLTGTLDLSGYGTFSETMSGGVTVAGSLAPANTPPPNVNAGNGGTPNLVSFLTYSGLTPTFAITFDSFTVGTGSTILSTGTQIYSITSAFDGGDTLYFTATSYSTLTGPTGPNEGGVYLNGTFSDSNNFFTPTLGTVDFSENGSGTSFTEDGSISATPEPNSLILLGTGLLGGAGMLMRKRRIA